MGFNSGFKGLMFHNKEPKQPSYKKAWPVKGLYRAEKELSVYAPQMLILVVIFVCGAVTQRGS